MVFYYFLLSRNIHKVVGGGIMKALTAYLGMNVLFTRTSRRG